ncbi:MAG: hypothetical protein GEV08_06120 [Acidimicrobiia bacterium]|nr:hypothetical protein [Acidimicrobiia bacterium]
MRVSKRPRYQIAGDLGVSDTSPAKWMAEQRGKDDDSDELDVPERAELEQLRAEKREWVVQREILKGGMAFWVRESRG